MKEGQNNGRASYKNWCLRDSDTTNGHQLNSLDIGSQVYFLTSFIVEWTKPYLSNKRRYFLRDRSTIEGQYSHSRAHVAAALSSQCLSVEPIRPNMDKVVKILVQLEEPKDTQKKGSDHRVCNSGLTHSAYGKGNADAPKNSYVYPIPSASLLHA